MSESFKQRIVNDMKDAMRAKEKDRLGVIRLITSSIKQIEVDERIDDLSDERVLAVLQKMVKQRKDSIEQFIKGGRQDLADVETYELSVLEAYLPEQMSDTEIDALINEALSSTGASSMKDMGKVMGILKNKTEGRADMGILSARIKAKLS